jgi:hypothetical protein
MTLEAAVDQLGLQPRDVVRLDAQTAAVVRGVPAGVELLLFQRSAGGSWDGVGAATGELRTAGDGRAGSVPFGEPNWEQLVFGIGPSGVERVELIAADGEAMIVNPDAGTWLIALREQVSIDRLRVRLIGADDEVLFDAEGLAPAE